MLPETPSSRGKVFFATRVSELGGVTSITFVTQVVHECVAAAPSSTVATVLAWKPAARRSRSSKGPEIGREVHRLS